MSDFSYAAAERVQERTPAIVVYVLYLVGTTIAVTSIVGLILAYLRKGQAGPVWASHYSFQIRTFWLALLGVVLGGALMTGGSWQAMILSALVMAGVGIWALARTIVGLLKAVQHEPIRDPQTLSIGL